MKKNMNPKSNDANNKQQQQKSGTVTIEGGYATLRYERRLSHSPEVVWKAITDPRELAVWFNTKAAIDARPGGTIDFVSAPSGFHTTGRILVWDPPRIFEHEWHIASHPHIPGGEPESVIRWELVQDAAGSTLLTVTHRHLTKSTALGFAPGMHAFLERLAAHLDREALPGWMERYAAVQGSYPSWQR
jgi:uncharacterized protein YndB with AHSA1/START domain